MWIQKNKILTACLCFLLFLSGLSNTVCASQSVQTDKECTLSIVFKPEEKAAAGTEFRIYRVADMSYNGIFTLAGDFTNASVDLKVEDTDGWRILATTLQGFVNEHQITALESNAADADGTVSFDNLPTGLYLVLGENWKSGDTIYTPVPALISLPAKDIEDNWQYDVEERLKWESSTSPTPEQNKITVSTMKIWDDNNSEKRPSSVKISLYAGTELYETVILNKKNNWKYQWSELDGNIVWSVWESEVPDEYSVRIEKQGTNFVVTNKSTERNPSTPDTDDKLPQTGMLWWPVPILILLGLGCLITGRIRYKKVTHEEK